ncbi:hypothetical protein WKV44_08135 [Spirochaetia bacterium 38H-sp]|uniref:Uncharacterized protein n=1 Tax=Rarispira pelagica TaxID=3141764 RepID=A0ABU9UCX2_9SPIR
MQNTGQHCFVGRNKGQKKRILSLKHIEDGIAITTENCNGFYGEDGVIFEDKYESVQIPGDRLTEQHLENITGDKKLLKAIKNTWEKRTLRILSLVCTL